MFSLQARRVALLEQKLREGYCLHGSPHVGLVVLEPRPAHCNSGRPEGNLTAVYADRNGVQVPIVAALLSGKGNSQWHGDDGVHLKVTGNRTFARGVVYVLRSDTFKDVNGEWVSFLPVAPIDSIRVTPSILHYLVERGTLDLHIPIPAPW